MPWLQRQFTDFTGQLAWIVPKYQAPTTKPDRKQAASEAWDGLRPLQTDLAEIASAAHLPFFQATTNRDAGAVHQSNLGQLSVMQQLHFLFQLRASTLLALERPQEAGEDVLTSLRVAQLARQSPDAGSSARVQFMLAGSLQPVWEGLAEHRWDESQLAAFQQELLRFNLFADYTNAVHRVVLAYIETWNLAAGQIDPGSMPQSSVTYGWQPDGNGNPQAWRFENSMNLFEAGQEAIANVDAAAGQVREIDKGFDLNGLTLDASADQLFEQASWYGATPALVSFTQNALNQAILACAVERFRLSHGRVSRDAG